MQKEIQLLVLVLILSMGINISLAVYLWNKRRELIGRYLFYLELAISIWTGAAMFEAIGSTVELKLLWTRISFFGVLSVPALYFLLAKAYAQQFQYLNKKSLLFISIFPVLTLMVIWSDPIHHWFYTQITVDPLSNVTTYHYGMWFWMFVLYAYGLLLAGLMTFIRDLTRHPSIFKPQIVLLILGAALPLVGNILHLSDMTPIAGLDVTPVFFTLSGVFITWGIFKYNLLNLVPAARHRLIESMSSAIIVVDPHQNVVDINPAMENILGLSIAKILGRSLTSLQGRLGELYTFLSQKQPAQQEIHFDNHGIQSWYQLDITRLTDAKHEFQGILALLTDITEKKHLTNKLKDAENLYRSITETAQYGILTIDITETIVSANRAVCETFGYTPDELIGQPVMKLMKDNEQVRHQQLFDRFIKTGERTFDWNNHEVTGIHKTGVEIALDVTFSEFTMKGNRFFAGILHDISVRKSEEQKSRFLHELNQSIVASSPLGILTIGQDGGVTSANPAFLAMVGSPGIEKTMGLKIDMETVRDAGVFKTLKKTLDLGEPFYIKQLKYISKWGNRLVLNVRGVPLTSGGAAQLGMVAIVEDVTDSVKLKENYNMLSEVVTHSPARILITDKDGIIKYVNPAFESITGYSKDEVIGKKPNILKSGEHPDEFYKELWMTITAGGTWCNQIQNKKKNGSLFWEEATISSIKNSDNEITRYMLIAHDITKQKNTENDLTASRDMLKALSEATFESIFLSENGRCLGQNHTAERMFGYTNSEALGKWGTDWIAEEDRDTVLEHILQGYELPYEVTARRKDGATFPCEIQGRMIKFNGRRVRVTALRDISLRKAAFDKIIEQSENIRKMSNELINSHEKERKSLSMELHDEFGQALTATLLNIVQLEDILGGIDIPDVHKMLSESRMMINLMNDQIHELTLRLHPMILDELGLISAMNWYLDRYSERTNINISKVIDKPDARYPEKLEITFFRILQEALNNTAKYAQATEVYVEINAGDNSLSLIIRDNGIGFDSEKFYYDLHERQKLGLRGMKERINYQGGDFSLNTRTGAGTEIIATLPLGLP